MRKVADRGDHISDTLQPDLGSIAEVERATRLLHKLLVTLEPANDWHSLTSLRRALISFASGQRNKMDKASFVFRVALSDQSCASQETGNEQAFVVDTPPLDHAGLCASPARNHRDRPHPVL
ncbi:hypothetical protein ACQ86E_27440 [Bradyrhizobium betae]|uniref:hypothetical protein n=1 Tax=Bradyrhizobium betae TaxID=244734 RepID=UPI003D679665